MVVVVVGAGEVVVDPNPVPRQGAMNPMGLHLIQNLLMMVEQ